MDGQRLERLIADMENRDILVVGDIMLDRYVYGHVDRISPEAPIPVLSVTREDSMLGGAGNALANLAGLGVKARILSIIGDDAAGAEIRRHLQAIGVSDADLIIDPDRPTIIKTRYVAGPQQLLRSDFESKAPFRLAVRQAVLKHLQAHIGSASCILISDYGKGLLTPDSLAAVIGFAKAQGIPVAVDPKGRDFSIYRGAALITPNRKELSDATGGGDLASDEDITNAARRIIESCGVRAVLATRSRDGMTLLQKGQNPFHVRSPDIEVFDVSGAGDAVIAVMAAGLACGAGLEESAALANIAGGLVVQKTGTAPLRRQELLEAVHEPGGFAYADKKAPLVTLAEAQEHIKRWKVKNLVTGFTNGCFDILHAGHVTYLNAARGRCDRLIVALNSDASVRLLKGLERPVHDEKARAAVLAALAAVDLVILFGAEKTGEDNTAGALLRALKPDLYFKGGDYAPEQIPEAPIVAAYGGQVFIVPAVEGQSTTESLKRLSRGARS